MNTYRYEEDYFETFYVTEVGDASPRTFEQKRNLFKAIFHTIHKQYPMKNGGGKLAIEFGCAFGAAASVLKEYGYSVTATDTSSYALKRARVLSPTILFKKHDMGKLFKTTKKFSFVYSFDVIEHLKNPQKAIKHMYSLVERDGIVVCSTPNYYDYAIKMMSHINVKRPKEWEAIFLKAGFSNVIIKQFTFFPIFIDSTGD